MTVGEYKLTELRADSKCFHNLFVGNTDFQDIRNNNITALDFKHYACLILYELCITSL